MHCIVFKCNNEAEYGLCELHRKQAQSMDYQITACEQCNRILTIERKTKSMKSVQLIKLCQYCQIKKGESDENRF